jgi:site-specific recombinase XerD
MTIEKSILQFLEFLEIEKNRSQKTIENYTNYLEHFRSWAEECDITKVREIKNDTVHAYRLWLNRTRQEKKYRKTTQNYHLIALRAFIRYLSRQGVKIVSSEKIELSKTPRRKILYLSHENLQRLLDAPLHALESDVIRTRDKALLELLFSTGLRVSELASLTRRDVRLSRDEFTISGKGKLRTAFLSPRAKEYLAKYLDCRKDSLSPLFIRCDRASAITKQAVGKNNHRLCLTARSIQRIIKHYAARAGIGTTITPQIIRHTFARNLLRSGVEVHLVQKLLGHAHAATTQKHAHFTADELMDLRRAEKKLKAID